MRMDHQTFLDSLSLDKAPSNLTPLQEAMWHDGKGDWHAAHEIAQDVESPEGAWIHAYLHRKEGDIWNANYWYRRAGRSLPGESLQEEWHTIVAALFSA